MRSATRGTIGLLIAVAAGSCAPIPHAPTIAQAPPPLPAAPPATQIEPSARIAETAGFGLVGVAEQGGLMRGIVPARTRTLTLDGQPLAFARDGAFVIAFDRDAPPAAVLLAMTADGRLLRRDVAVAQRRWDIQSLPTLHRGTSPTPDFVRRRADELRQINAARAIGADSEGWRQAFLWPVTGRISGVFGSQRIYAGEPGAYHSGVDVARPAGTPVVAPADGVVILAAAAPFTLEGNLLMIDHGMGLNSAFLHLSKILVAPGEHVVRGQLIGLIGMTGRATGPHLHWGLKWHDRRIDPALLAGAMPGGATHAASPALPPGD